MSARSKLVRPLRLLASAALMALAGCTTVQQAPYHAPPPELGMQIVNLRHLVHFATDRDRPDAAEASALAGFIDSLDRHAVTAVKVIGHADRRAADTYNLELSSRRATEVARRLEAAGLDVTDVSVLALGEQAPLAEGDDEAAWRRNRRVEIRVDAVVVDMPGCPDWSGPISLDDRNLPMSNFGCATTTNFARMLAYPEDLLAMRPSVPGDPVRESLAIERYRTDAVKTINEETTP